MTDEVHLVRPGPGGAVLSWHVLRRAPGAPPVLLLHGLASNASRFAEFSAHTTLARHHALVRVDLRGHGAALTRGRTTISEWSEDLLAILDAEGGGPALLVGHSLGAQVALQFARRHPARVKALVLIDPVFRAALHGRWLLLARAAPLLAAAAAMIRLGNRLGLNRGALPPLDLRALDAMAREALASPESEQAFIAQYSSARADLRHVPTAVYLQDLVELFRDAPLPRELPQPVLALLSTGATFAAADEMRALLEGPRVTIAPVDCHHWPLTEKPAEVRQAIERWCADHLPG